MISKLAPILNAKWTADPQHADFIHGVDAEGAPYLISAPPGVRDLIVLMQNNLVMDRQYEAALIQQLAECILEYNNHDQK